MYYPINPYFKFNTLGHQIFHEAQGVEPPFQVVEPLVQQFYMFQRQSLDQKMGKILQVMAPVEELVQKVVGPVVKVLTWHPC